MRAGAKAFFLIYLFISIPYKKLYSYADTQTNAHELTGTIWMLEKPNFK